jgi:two-component system response regulator AtoC
VRVIAATNGDLERAVESGQFREDLFFRLNVVSIHMPPLRERRDEIPQLTEYFLKKYSVQYNKPLTEVSPDTLRLLTEYDWPGNVRELENLIRRAVVLGESAIQKELNHGIAMTQRTAAARAAMAAAQPPAVSPPPQPAHGANGSHRPNGATAHADDRANYSLKDISRTAAREAERELILKMLQRTRWNRKETAEILGISYKALLYKIKENGLDKAS